MATREATEWPKQFDMPQVSVPEEEREVCHIVIEDYQEPLNATVVYEYLIMCVGASFCFLSMLSSRAHE